jgi:hypothetical protein
LQIAHQGYSMKEGGSMTPDPVDMSIETNEESILHLPAPKMLMFLAVTLVGCIVLAFVAGPSEWGPVRRVALGLVGGGWCYLCIFINRVFVA